MKRTLGLLIILGLAATPALAQKVNIDYAHDYDFSGPETFQYVNTEESNADNPMMAEYRPLRLEMKVCLLQYGQRS